MEGRRQGGVMVRQRTGDGTGDGAAVLLLADAETPVERELIDEWLRTAGERPAAVLPLRAGSVAGALTDADDATVVAPVRVVWQPRERDGRRLFRWSDLVSLGNPRRPTRWAQARIARREPDRAAVVLADTATVGELRARLAERAGTGSTDGRGADLAAFTVQQAELALLRAERAVVGDRYKVPTHIVEAIGASREFRGAVAELAGRLELPEAEVRERAERDLHGLVASMSPVAVDVLTGLLRPLHSRAWKVHVDTAGLAKLRELNRTQPLVFLPSHRSYTDPFLLADVLAEHDFPRNHVLGGENLRFWPVGPLAKRAGIVFIRRSFGDDEVYKLAVREYFGYLLAKRFNLEWYMEGGRSRTGKLRPPRHGLLRFVADAVERKRVEDVYLVPVSITYDQLREVSGMAAEQGGAAKRGEGLSWMASYIREQVRTPLGTVHVGFAEPLSLAAALHGGADPADPDARRLTL